MHLINDGSIRSGNGFISAAITSTTTTTCLVGALPLTSDQPMDVARIADERYIQEVISNVLGSYHLLASLPSLEPSTIVNGAFGRLVEIAVRVPRDEIADKVSVRKWSNCKAR